KGHTLTVDVSPYVNSSQPWQLVAVTDPKGLVSGIAVSDSQFVMTADYPGLTELQWQIVQDEQHFSSIALLAVQDDTPTNQAPEAEPIVLSTLSDTPLTIDLAAVLSDADDDALSITSFVQAGERFEQQGMTVTYSPNGYVGNDAALYSVDDGRGGTAIGQISIVVNDANPVEPNTPPTAANHNVSLEQGSVVEVDIRPLVDDADGDSVVLNRLLAASNRATISDSHTITYYGAGFSGEDSLIYVVSDGRGGFAQAEIDFTVTEVDAPAPLQLLPVVRDMTVGDTDTVDLSQDVSSGLPWTLTEVQDSSGLVKVEGVVSPKVTLTALAPGIAELTYTVLSGDERQSSQLLVSVSEADNTPPFGRNVAASTDNETPITLDLNSGLSDPDGDPVSVTQLVQVAKPVRFSLEADNRVLYTPRGFVGVDSATYVVSDGRGGYDLGQIVVNVSDANPSIPNTPPTAGNYTQATDSDTAVSLDLLELKLIGDGDGDELEITLYSGEGRAQVSGSVVTYTPDGFIGSDEVVYEVDDGRGGHAIGKLLFVVSDATPVNNLPQAESTTVELSLQQVLSQPEQVIEL
ncbi:Ig-like domain-containing protein, partial [Shewanella algae]|uniref:Ig-like domain-containing protein n=1 Tax=Shewanella algae TaxID=38313 RepID=UPI00313E8AE6